MKRKTLCCSLVFLFVLLFCTLLSPKIEDEMRVQVELKHISGSNPKRNSNVPMSALLWEDGVEQLYSVAEGNGWESGLRVTQIPRQYYSVIRGMDGKSAGHVQLGPGTEYDLILSACRRPEDGAMVEVVEEFTTGEDVYLICCPLGIASPENLPLVLEPVSSSDTAILAKSSKAKFPFFEMRIRNSLNKVGAEEVRVYSMTDAEGFLRALPWVTSIATILLVGLVLCIGNCIVAGGEDMPVVLLWVNAIIPAAGLGLIPVLTGKFDLPASLMPRQSALDVSHYLEEFKTIFAALEQLGADTLRAALEQSIPRCWCILGVGLGTVIVLFVLEWLIFRRIQKREEQ